jgi:3-oxoadipate enol-lactonase / 4-carboxymuconolactone decarboxylase
MPLLTIGSDSHYYRLDGAECQPVLFLSHSLGLDHGMWDEQVPDLLPHFRVLRYDTRGHGASGVTPGDYTIGQLASDALAIADRLEIRQFAFCGLSLGGMIGQWLSVNAPERLTHLVLANTTARVAEPPAMETRRRAVLDGGMTAIENVVMARFFSLRFLEQNPPRVASARRTLLATDPVGYAGCCAAIRDMDHGALLPKIRTPTLVISGDYDVGMPWQGHGDVLTREIKGARAVRLPAAHISNLERPRSFLAALLDFLVPVPADPLEAGMAVRRAVLGDAHVDRATGSATDFTREFQDLLTKYAWGATWTRPGLDRRTRRLLVIAVTAAMGRWEEFRLHVRTGLANDLELCDVKEVLLQLAIYAGVPTANSAFHAVEEENRAGSSVVR